MDSEKPEEIKRKVPKWAKQPFTDFLDFVETVAQVVELSTAGISALPHVKGLTGISILAPNRPHYTHLEGFQHTIFFGWAQEIGTGSRLPQRESRNC